MCDTTQLERSNNMGVGGESTVMHVNEGARAQRHQAMRWMDGWMDGEREKMRVSRERREGQLDVNVHDTSRA